MSYEFISPNIITRQNLLSDQELDVLYRELEANEKLFAQSHWGTTDKKSSTRYCNGHDIWVLPQNANQWPQIWGLSKFFLNKEFMDFVAQTNNSFSFMLNSKVNIVAHCVTYKTGGSYDKHMDLHINREGKLVKNFYTFNLTLQRGAKMSGGEGVLYDPDEVVIDKLHNNLTIFPSFINHSVNAVQSAEDVAFKEQRFSIQFWVTLI